MMKTGALLSAFLLSGLLLISSIALAAPDSVEEFFDLLLEENQSIDQVITTAKALYAFTGEDAHRRLEHELEQKRDYLANFPFLVMQYTSEFIGRTHDVAAIKALSWAAIRRQLESDDSVERTISNLEALREIARSEGLWPSVSKKISQNLVEKYTSHGEPEGIRRLLFVFFRLSAEAVDAGTSQVHFVHQPLDPVVEEFAYSMLSSAVDGIRKRAAENLVLFGPEHRILAAFKGEGIEADHLTAAQLAILNEVKHVDRIAEKPEIQEAVRALAPAHVGEQAWEDALKTFELSAGFSQNLRRIAADPELRKRVCEALGLLTGGGEESEGFELSLFQSRE